MLKRRMIAAAVGLIVSAVAAGFGTAAAEPVRIRIGWIAAPGQLDSFLFGRWVRLPMK